MTPVGIFALWAASTIGGMLAGFILLAYLASNSR
ncbi:hypothetical protein KOXY103107_01900 [Komagataeibacter xylinus]